LLVFESRHSRLYAAMDKKAKKRIEVLRTKLQKLEQLLSAAKRQRDDEQEVARLERDVASVKAEIAKARGE
jgi:hypothetical protein